MAMKITVSLAAGGWIVTDGETLGPFSKQRALDLAEGMAVAIRTHLNEEVEIVVLDQTQV